MKLNFEQQKQFIIEFFLNIPVIEGCEVINENKNSFDILLKMSGETEWRFRIIPLKKAYPKEIYRIANDSSIRSTEFYTVILAPFVSKESAHLCEKNGIGFVDESGNALICFHTLYINKIGSPNKKPEIRDVIELFNPHAVTSSLILRKLLECPNHTWKLKYLAEEVGCSIGLVSKVKEALCNQMLAEMTKEGLSLTQPETLLKYWAEKYKLPEQTGCYTLDTIPAFEKKLQELYNTQGIRMYLTGFSGGVRYAPVVRYNRIHIFLQPEDIPSFLQYSGCKKVDSGANVILLSSREDYIFGAEEKNGDHVVSPVQAYLDCMQLKGRGEELADAILTKEILR